jgi:hypothetical protein
MSAPYRWPKRLTTVFAGPTARAGKLGGRGYLGRFTAGPLIVG